jgi:hypothetical protein
MVVNLCQQFNLFRPGTLNGGIVKNKYGFVIFVVNPSMNS